MKGDDLLKEVERRIMKDKGTKSVTDSVLAKTLGITQPQLGNYRGKDLSPRQVVNLLETHSKAEERQLVEAAILPIEEGSEESRVGQEGVSTCRYSVSPYN